MEGRSSYSLTAVALIFATPALGGFLFGYDISSTSYAVLQFGFHSAALEGLVVSAPSLGAFLGSVFIFRLSDWLGRRAELRIGAVLYMVGASLEVLSGAAVLPDWLFVGLLLIGRTVYGFGIAFAMHGGPTYISEMAPSEMRGLLVSLKEAAIVAGILTGYVLGNAFSKTTGGWVYAYGCSLLMSSTMLVLSLFTIPRSCRWLVLSGLDDEALESMRFVYTEERALEEFHSMEEFVEAAESAEVQTGRVATSVFDPKCRAAVIAGIGLVVLQQVTGQPSILSYAAPIFKQAGIGDSSSILVAAFKLVATLLAAATVEHYGRKKLLYIGNSLMFVALIVLAGSFGVSSAGPPTIILGAMFLYIGGYQFSFGPISWLMISEVFPLRVRGQAVAAAVQTNFLLNAMVQFAVPLLEHFIGLQVTFGVFAALTAYSIYFVKMRVPETKGLTLEEIESQFEAMQEQGPLAVTDFTPLIYEEQAERFQIESDTVIRNREV